MKMMRWNTKWYNISSILHTIIFQLDCWLNMSLFTEFEWKCRRNRLKFDNLKIMQLTDNDDYQLTEH